MPNEFKESGAYYVSKSGSNLNAGTDPDLPKLTIADGLAVGGGQGIIGTGVYEEKNLDLGEIKADGVVVIKSDGTTDPALIGFGGSTIETVDGFIFVGFAENYSVPTGSARNRGNNIKNCKFIGGSISDYHSDFSGGLFSEVQNNVYLNVSYSIDYIASDQELFLYKGHMFIGNYEYNIITPVFRANTTIINCHFGENGKITVIEPQYLEIISFCNVRCPIEVNGTLFSSMEACKGTYPNAFPNCINQDPLYLGSATRLELTVAENSPLIGSGRLGVNIGNVRIGNLQNRNSLEWGLNPEESGNTAFDANSALILTSGTSSQRKSRPIFLGQKRRSPRLILNGITDFLNSTPDNNNALVNPNHLTIGVVWGDSEAAVQALIDTDSWEFFRYGERMRVDGGGLYTGESNYDFDNETDLLFSWYAIGPIIRDDYNEA